MLIRALMAHQKVNRLMSCYQVFRVVLQQLISTDWTERPFHSAPQPPAGTIDPQTWGSGHEVVFLDSGGVLNLCAHVSRQHYLWLRHEAALALELLDQPGTHGFQSLFMTPLPLEHKFDVLCQ